jgi:hypothetical protein
MGTDECDWSETQSMSRPGVQDLSINSGKEFMLVL